MVSISAFRPRDPGSNPGWFTVSNSHRKLSCFNTPIIQAYDRVSSIDGQNYINIIVNLEIIYEAGLFIMLNLLFKLSIFSLKSKSMLPGSQ